MAATAEHTPLYMDSPEALGHAIGSAIERQVEMEAIASLHELRDLMDPLTLRVATLIAKRRMPEKEKIYENSVLARILQCTAMYRAFVLDDADINAFIIQGAAHPEYSRYSYLHAFYSEHEFLVTCINEAQTPEQMRASTPSYSETETTARFTRLALLRNASRQMEAALAVFTGIERGDLMLDPVEFDTAVAAIDSAVVVHPGLESMAVEVFGDAIACDYTGSDFRLTGFEVMDRVTDLRKLAEAMATLLSRTYCEHVRNIVLGHLRRTGDWG